MKCCGRDVTSVDLKVAGQPYELLRCGDCNVSYWMRDGVQVSADEVTKAMQDETRATAEATAARRAERARSGL